MKKLYIKSVSLGKNEINVSIYESGSKNILRYGFPNTKDSLILILSNILKKIWDCYPSANNGLWKYIQVELTSYCKDNNIYITKETCFEENSDVFRYFISKLEGSIKEKKKFFIRSENGFYLEKKDTSFNFKLTERKLNAYKFSFCEKELFKLLMKNDPIFSKIYVEVV